MPFTELRRQQNFFFDFFRNANEFIDFIKTNILGYSDDDSEETKKEYISDDFMKVFYYGFKRRYRNVIVYEQEWFYDDFIFYFVDRKRKFELLYDLWIQENEENPFDMINISNERTLTHTGSDERTQESSSSNESTSGARHKENDGQIQGKLAIDEIGTDGDKTYATNVSVDKNNSQSNGSGETKGYGSDKSQDIVKSQAISKTNVIANFTRQDLREGFQYFIETFSSLFSKLNARYFNWYGYWETNFDEIPKFDNDEDY